LKRVVILLHQTTSAAVLALLAVAAPMFADEVVYLSNTSQLGTLNLSTGAYQQIGPNFPDASEGLGYAANGALLTMGFSGNLNAINPATGVMTTIGPSGLSACPPSCDSSSVNTLASFDGQIYATDFANRLYRVNHSARAVKRTITFSPVSAQSCSRVILRQRNSIQIPMYRCIHVCVMRGVPAGNEIGARYRSRAWDYARVSLGRDALGRKLRQAFSGSDRNRQTPTGAGSRRALNWNKKEASVRRPNRVTVTLAYDVRRSAAGGNRHDCLVSRTRNGRTSHDPSPAGRNAVNVKDGVWDDFGTVRAVRVHLLQIIGVAFCDLKQNLPARPEVRGGFTGMADLSSG
jgi:hypothetical protein